MIYNTRFNPTVNGYLHLGHAYMALVNQAEARRSGGKFIVRLDDTQVYWNWKNGDEQRYKDGMREDLAWMGIEADTWSSQNDLLGDVQRLADWIGYTMPRETFDDYEAVEVVGYPSLSFYPSSELFTAQHVLMDKIEGINCLIRGMDMITETNAYRIMAHQFGFARVRMVYLPRLQFEGDQVSKTKGCFKIRDFRKAGLEPAEVLSMLEIDCLKDVRGGWYTENIKHQPVLGEWAKEALYAVCQ